MRMLTTLTVVTVSALTLGIANAQTAKPATCGVETWSTDKMMYVTVPCTGESQQPAGQVAAKPAEGSNANCGIETWSTDKMAYVSTPCNAGTTYENPGSTQ